MEYTRVVSSFDKPTRTQPEWFMKANMYVPIAKP